MEDCQHFETGQSFELWELACLLKYSNFIIDQVATADPLASIKLREPIGYITSLETAAKKSQGTYDYFKFYDYLVLGFIHYKLNHFRTFYRIPQYQYYVLFIYSFLFWFY